MTKHHFNISYCYKSLKKQSFLFATVFSMSEPALPQLQLLRQIRPISILLYPNNYDIPKHSKDFFGIIIAILICLTACDSQNGAIYHATELSNIMVADRSFNLQDEADNIFEETVLKDFLYTITADFDLKYGILSDSHTISIENEKSNFDEGLYIKTYTIHQVETLLDEEYTDPASPLYYHNLDSLVEQYDLVEYHVVRVNFTQVLSEQANKLAPQWGDGSYERSFLVGKSNGDELYRIYDFGMM